MQTSSDTKKTKDNTEVTLSGICFVDARRSTPPGIDLEALQAKSEANGSPMQLVYGRAEHTVLVVDAMLDDTGVLHHTELGLV